MTKFIEMSADIPFLVVDEGQSFREAICHSLKTLGYKNFFQSMEGTSALATLRRENIGFIICERNLRQMSGMELLKEIRETPEFSRVPFIMMASEISKEDVVLASEYGIDGYLKKPFVMKDVSVRISSSMARYMDPTNPELMFEEARELFMAGDYAGSIEVYNKIALVMPNSGRVPVGIARCHRALQDLGEAERFLLKAIEINKFYVHAHHDLGVVYLLGDRFDDAIRCFDMAIQLSPSNPIRYESVSDILMRLERYSEAEGYLGRAVKLELVYPVLFSQMGKALFAQHKLDKAAQFFEKALRQQPDNTSFLNSMGICMKDMGRFEDSINYYNHALKLRPSDPKILFNKALCLMQMGELERSKKTFQAILKNEPNHEKAKAKIQELEELEKNGGAKPAPVKAAG